MTGLISLDQIGDGDLEWALQDQADGITASSSDEGTTVVALEVGEPSPQLARKLRNLFSQKALMAAEREIGNSDPVIRAIAERFILDRKSAEKRWCMNPTCLRYLGEPTQHTRGRKRLYCSSPCQAAAGTRRYRDKLDPGRADRLQDRLLLPRYVRPGYTGRAGNRRSRASIFGFDSLITPDIQEQRHRATVDGQAGVDSRLLDGLVDREWLRLRIKARHAPKLQRARDRQAALQALEEFDEFP